MFGATTRSSRQGRERRDETSFLFILCFTRISSRLHSTMMVYFQSTNNTTGPRQCGTHVATRGEKRKKNRTATWDKRKGESPLEHTTVYAKLCWRLTSVPLVGYSWLGPRCLTGPTIQSLTFFLVFPPALRSKPRPLSTLAPADRRGFSACTPCPGIQRLLTFPGPFFARWGGSALETTWLHGQSKKKV